MGRIVIKKKKVIQIFLLLTCSILFAVFVCELIIRQFFEISTFKYVSSNHLNWNMDDPDRKYQLTPGYVGELQATEFKNEIKINSHGFRGIEPKLNPQDKPIFVIGDSFVFGVGVEVDQAIPGRIQAHLNENKIKKEVWNLGIPSHTFQQYMHTLKKNLAIQKPSAVVFFATMSKLPSGASDLTGASILWEEAQQNQQHTKPDDQSPKVSKTKKHKPKKKFRLKKWLARNSALYNFIILRAGPVIRAYTHSSYELNEMDKKHKKKGWEIFSQSLDELKALSQQHQFELVVVYVAMRTDIQIQFKDLSTQFKSLLKEKNVEHLDSFDFVEAEKAHELYYTIDGHLTPKGCDLFAKTIVEQVMLKWSLGHP